MSRKQHVFVRKPGMRPHPTEKEKKDGGLTYETLETKKKTIHVVYDPTIKVCAWCKHRGHKIEECQEVVCRICGEKGHVDSVCKKEKVCRRCKGEGHINIECHEPVRCWRCKAEDHTIGDCPVDLVVEEVGKENHPSDAQEELRSLPCRP